MAEEILRLTDVFLKDSNRTLLSDIDFTLYAGEVHGVISTMPSDQNSFILLLTGSSLIVEGEIRYLGQIRNRGRRLYQPYGISVIPQPSLFSALTIVENVYAAEHTGLSISSPSKKKRLRQLMEEFQLQIDLHEKIDNLTHEEKKVLEVLRVLVSSARLVVLQDTFYQLGSQYRYFLLRAIRRMKKEGRGVIYITSNIEDALAISDRLSIMDSGRIRDMFTVDEANDNPKKIIELLSGWSGLYNHVEGDNYEALETITCARELISSGNELKNVLLSLAVQLEKLLHCENAAVFLINKETQANLDTIHAKTDPPCILPLSILLDHGDGDIFSLEAEEISLLGVSKSPFRTVIYGIFLSREQTGVIIQAGFKEAHISGKKDFRFVRAFGREMLIAIETSRLLGNSVLLQESHHRIKNNIQIIINLLYLQKMNLLAGTNASILEIFDTVIDRVKSIAIVHNLLSKGGLGKNMVKISRIVNEVIKIYNIEDIHITKDIEDVSVPYDKAVSIAMLINELVSNCIKHAFFPGQTEKCIDVVFKRSDDSFLLTITDNGMGFPESFQGSSDSLGMEIVNSITMSLNGTAAFITNRGAAVRITFPIAGLYA